MLRQTLSEAVYLLGARAVVLLLGCSPGPGLDARVHRGPLYKVVRFQTERMFRYFNSRL